jgi:hypothetical protein
MRAACWTDIGQVWKVATQVGRASARRGPTMKALRQLPRSPHKPIATNPKNGKTYVTTGWVQASAFCS